MSNHLVIIDAMNLIRRVHAAQPDPDDIAQTAHNSGRTLQKIIRAASPSHIVAVFDYQGEEQSWRAKLMPEYKQGRAPIYPALAAGLDKIQDDFWQLGVDALVSNGDEANDMIATLACKTAQRQLQTTIVSTDKNYCQLVPYGVQIRDYFQQRWLDAQFIERQFDVMPTQLVDFWGLTGISSSNIKGVSGIGPKGASELLRLYGNLEALFSATDLAPKWQKKLADQQQTAFTAREIAKLKTDIALGFNLKDIRYSRPT